MWIVRFSFACCTFVMGNYSKYFLERCLNVVIQPTNFIYAVIPGKRVVINKFNHGTRRVPSCSKPPQVLKDCSPLIRERTTSHFPHVGQLPDFAHVPVMHDSHM